ncbi:MAG: ABC transporter permease [Candidatus Saccharicenans sp.]
MFSSGDLKRRIRERLAVLNFQRIRPLVKKEFIITGRDPISLVLLLVLPTFLLVMFGYALNFDLKHLNLAVVDFDRSPLSRELLQKMTAGEYFDIKYRLESISEIDSLFENEKIKMALVIPENFCRDILRGESPAIQVLVDGTSSTTAQIALGYIGNILLDHSAGLNLEILERSGLKKDAVMPVESRLRVWYNPELRSAMFLVPGLMAFILMIIIVLSTSLSIVREKEKGTINQLRLSPLTPAEMITGKIIPYLILSLVGAHLVLLAGWTLFKIGIKGSYPNLLLVLILFLFCGLSQGLLISTAANSQQVAFLMAGLTTLLPTFILSGFVFPIRNMPQIIQMLTYIIPARYFLVCLRSIILKGAGFAAYYREVLFLLLYGLIMTALSSRFVRRSLDR